MRVLLIIDDYDDMRALFRRFLSGSFDEIHGVGTVPEAEAVLASGTVTHLVVDSNLGPDCPQSEHLVAQWRAKWPGIRFAASFSGRIEPDGLPEGLDAVFQKPNGFDGLIAALESPDPSS